MSGNVRERDVQRFFARAEARHTEHQSGTNQRIYPGSYPRHYPFLGVVRGAPAGPLSGSGVWDRRRGGEESPDPETVAALREKGEAFEEIRKAHEALLYAVGRGYVDISELSSGE